MPHWPQHEWVQPCLARSSNRYRYGEMINNNCRFRDNSEGMPHDHNDNTLPDVGVFACPGSEGLQLRFWLAHPGVEEIELAKFPRAHPCIAIDRVVSEKYKIAIGINQNQASVTREKGTHRLWCSTKHTTLCFFDRSINSKWCDSSCVAGFVTRTCRPRSIA